MAILVYLAGQYRFGKIWSCVLFYAVATIFQSYNGGKLIFLHCSEAERVTIV